MGSNQRYTVPYRRKREGKTNYRKRLLLLGGHFPRLVVRPTLKYVLAQLVIYSPTGDKVVCSCHSRELLKQGWKGHGRNVPSAYLVGYALGKKAKQQKISKAILDLGYASSVKGCLIYATVKGALDAGLTISCDPKQLPSEDRVLGKHIAHYATLLEKDQPASYKTRFSVYLRNNLKPQDLPNHVADIKKKLA